MTESEKKQTYGVFRNAGYAAFHLAELVIPADSKSRGQITQIPNPYHEAPFSDLWTKGWRDAAREAYLGVPFRSIPYADPRRKGDTKKIENKKTAGHTKWAHVRNKRETSTINGLENKFNNKRTKV